ncbi:hypothetical protein INT46_002293 [Mucor plumbeus]|uniref:Uncharacterized protein n=1 Tax=Mucor plumbeus TaxID=97098 RepID=A0A8H7QXB0_9FUNG|nr:hypothetical protein INT46_002293 [Mucor plumbeus]
MFRSRKYSQSSSPVQTTSSLSSGNASIKRPAVVTPIEEQHHHQQQQQIHFDEHDEINHDEIIDLQAPQQQQPDLTIESMSAVLAAAVQMSSAGGAPSSLSLGSASILQPFAKTEEITVKRKFSARLFMNPWKKSSVSTSPTTPTTPGLEPSSPFDSTLDDDNSSQGSPRSSSISGSRTSTTTADDGRDELLYRGIQIKEIKSTLKTLVISDEQRYPMPEVRLERPGFARVNY